MQKTLKPIKHSIRAEDLLNPRFATAVLLLESANRGLPKAIPNAGKAASLFHGVSKNSLKKGNTKTALRASDLCISALNKAFELKSANQVTPLDHYNFGVAHKQKAVILREMRFKIDPTGKEARMEHYRMYESSDDEFALAARYFESEFGELKRDSLAGRPTHRSPGDAQYDIAFARASRGFVLWA